MRYIVDRCGHRESFKSLRAAKESMNWLGSGFYTLIDTKKNTETLYFSLGNNVFRVKWRNLWMRVIIMTRTEFKRNINQSMKRIADELVYMMQLNDYASEEGVVNEDVDAIISDLSDAYNVAQFALSGIE